MSYRKAYHGRASMAALVAGGIAHPSFERKEDGGGTPPAPTNEVKEAVNLLTKTVNDHKTAMEREIAELKKTGNVSPETKSELDKINTALSEMKAHVDSLRLEDQRPFVEGPNGTKRQLSEVEVKHAKAVRDYMTKGDESGFSVPEVKALSVGSNPDGGYAVTPEMDRQISRIISEASPIRPYANVVSIGTSTFKRLVNIGGTDSGWVGEGSSRPATNNAQLQERNYPAMELYAMPTATQTLLDDANFDMESWLADEVQIEFAEEEATAFVMGDGVSKPRGFVGGYTHVTNGSFNESVGGYGYVPTGAAGAFKTAATGDNENNIIDLVAALKAAYRSGGRFFCSRATLFSIRKFRDANGLSYWQPSLAAGVPDTILGYPVTEAEDMPAIAANSFSLAFGDLNRAYQIVDRMGTRILRDPYSAKPFVQFYTTKRVGGGARMFEALKLLKFATS